MTKKKILVLFMGLLIMIIGCGILFYPEISNYVNQKNQSYAIEKHETYISEVKFEDVEESLSAADIYNQKIYDFHSIRSAKAAAAAGKLDEYWDILNEQGDNILGIIDIPKIDVHLPIYHGTDNENLRVGIGHIQHTSFPSGKPNTHAAVCGHTALASAKLFTDLDQLEEGDEFFVTIMNQVLNYEVDDIRIINPHDYDCLDVVEGESYLTMVTCTPPGVGSHRLLVRGHYVAEEKMENPENS